MKNGIALIFEERLRQMEEEGWTPEHDDTHENEELADAAACYALPEKHRFHSYHNGKPVQDLWPFVDPDSYKPCPDDRIRELVKAGALIAAEIDRLQRLQELNKKEWS